MVERPILFSGPMVRAILDGRKTQTRRIFKGVEPMGDGTWHVFGSGGGNVLVHTADIPAVAVDYARFVVGDVLWVRETWTHVGVGVWSIANARMVGRGGVRYKADGAIKGAGYWPSIHMPREFSRVTLDVTGVKVERLQDISEDDAIAEGVAVVRSGWWSAAEGQAGATPRAAYALLWNSINGPGSWDANPWVVAITFTRRPSPTETQP